MVDKICSMPVFSTIPGEFVKIGNCNVNLAYFVIFSDKSLHEHPPIRVSQNQVILRGYT